MRNHLWFVLFVPPTASVHMTVVVKQGAPAACSLVQSTNRARAALPNRTPFGQRRSGSSDDIYFHTQLTLYQKVFV
jgi:hypothetical protein